MLYCLSTPWKVVIIVAVIVVVLALFVIYPIVTHNSFVTLRNGCDEAWSGIDIYLKKRYDLIPNLVETVKGYAKHESGTLERVIAARNAAASASSPNEKIAADNALSGSLRQLFSLKESYPELKANTQFLSLQTQLQTIETDLSQARKFYNGKCKAFNNKAEKFPSSIIAKAMKLERRSYFELDSEEERKNVKVQF